MTTGGFNSLTLPLQATRDLTSCLSLAAAVG
jgi:hypothetical protein